MPTLWFCYTYSRAYGKHFAYNVLRADMSVENGSKVPLIMFWQTGSIESHKNNLHKNDDFMNKELSKNCIHKW